MAAARASAFGDALVVKELAITNEQRGDIVTILQGFQPKWFAIFQAAKGNQQEMQKKIAEVHRDLIAKVVTKLNKEQQAKWQDAHRPRVRRQFWFHESGLRGHAAAADLDVAHERSERRSGGRAGRQADLRDVPLRGLTGLQRL